jgi:uncharacterized protein (DUF697 family)
MPADQPMPTDETPTGKSDDANDQAGGAAEGSIGPEGAEQEQEQEQEQDREHLARGLVKYYAAWSIGAGIVPVPFVDMLLVMGVQVQMLRKMSDLYGVPFSEHVARNLVGALVGGAGSEVVAGGLVGPVVRLIPGIGPFLGAMTMPAVAAASTYAVGMVFLQHFESGGTFLTFQPGQVREHFRKIFEGARKGRPLDPARA